jgi:hypothetical protein
VPWQINLPVLASLNLFRLKKFTNLLLQRTIINNLKTKAMKNKLTFILYALLGVCLAFTSCKRTKEQISVIKESSEDYSLGLRVQKNINEIKLYRQGHLLKSAEEIPVDSALQFIDETFNYTYSFWLTNYTKIYLDSTYIEIPLTSGGKVIKYCDLFAAYENATSNVRTVFHNYNKEPDKKIIGLQVQNFGLNPQTGYLRVLLISQIIDGQERATQTSYDYYYARDTYYCDGTIPPGGLCGAANIVEECTNFVLLPAPPPNYRVFFTGSVNRYPDPLDFSAGNTIDNFEDYYIYYGNSSVTGWDGSPSGTKCIEGDGIPDSEMDFYNHGIVDHVVPTLLNDPSLTGKSFQLCIVNSSDITGPPEIVQHIPTITFGFKHFAVIDFWPAYIE